VQIILDLFIHKDPAARVAFRADGAWLVSPGLDAPALAAAMAQAGAQLSTITAIARADGETDLVYHYRLGSQAANIKTVTRAGAMPSITPHCRAAAWIEREIHDLYAVTFTGHPNLARLLLPPGMPEGLFREPGGRAAKTA
jgi:NADH:ubiquinone oxidoreductase subunit C